MSQSEQQADVIKGTGATDAIKQQDGGEQTAADAIEKDDPHKVEKLSKLGHADDEAAEGSE